MIFEYVCARIVAFTIAGHFEKKIDARELKNKETRPLNNLKYKVPWSKRRAYLSLIRNQNQAALVKVCGN